MNCRAIAKIAPVPLVPETDLSTASRKLVAPTMPMPVAAAAVAVAVTVAVAKILVIAEMIDCKKKWHQQQKENSVVKPQRSDHGLCVAGPHADLLSHRRHEFWRRHFNPI